LKRFRSFFYTSLALLSTAVTFWLGYLVALYITASRELAVGLLIACGLLMAPFLFVVFIGLTAVNTSLTESLPTNLTLYYV
jgi:ABC-type spermidine/putrescine transport system permease subunit I